MSGADYKEGRGGYYLAAGMREAIDLLRRRGYVVLTPEQARLVRAAICPHAGSYALADMARASLSSDPAA